MKPPFVPSLVLLLAIAVPSLTLLPSWQAARSTPAGEVYLGFRFMPVDHFQYASFIRQARDDGRLLMENQFTGEPQRPSYLMPYFWALGLSARLTGASIPAVWECFRVTGGAFLILAFWRFTQRWLDRHRHRLMATALFALGGGVTWLFELLSLAGVPRAGLLTYPSEGFWNWSAFGTLFVGHWVWAAAAFLLLADALLARPGWRRDAALLVLPPAVWLIHPYAGMVAWLTIGLVPVIPLLARDPERARVSMRCVMPALLSFLPVGAYLLWARSDEVFRLASQHGFRWTVTYGIWWYPIAYGLLLPLAWRGLRAGARPPGRTGDLLLAWILAAAALSLDPFFSGVKFQYLLFPPLAAAASRGLVFTLASPGVFSRALVRPVGAAVLVVTLGLSAPAALATSMLRGPGEDVYAPESVVEACRWLSGQPPGVVLAGYWSSNRIPWLAGHKVYMGHWFLTIHEAGKREKVVRFFDAGVAAAERTAIMEATGARYLFYGPSERRAAPLAPDLPILAAYRNPGVTIYDIPRRVTSCVPADSSSSICSHEITPASTSSVNASRKSPDDPPDRYTALLISR